MSNQNFRNKAMCWFKCQTITQTDKKTDTPNDRQTDRQTDRRIDRQTNKLVDAGKGRGLMAASKP